MTDLLIRDAGSIIQVKPVSDTGAEWIDTHVSHEGWQWLAGWLGCDRRQGFDLLAGAATDGLVVGDDNDVVCKTCGGTYTQANFDSPRHFDHCYDPKRIQL